MSQFPISQDELRALTNEVVRELNEEARQAQQAAQAPPPPPTAEQAALAALERKEERTRMAVAARALLDEKWGPHGLDSTHLTDEEALSEAGLLLSEEEKTRRQQAADPVFTEQEARQAEIDSLVERWGRLDYTEKRQKAINLGLNPDEIEADWRAEMEKRVKL